MSFLGIGFLALLVLLGCTWFFYIKAVDMFTSDQPVEIALTPPSEEDYGTGEATLNRMRTAVHTGQAGTFVFTDAELNALIARDPEFAQRKGRTRIAMADSMMTVDLSVPLGKLHLPRLKNRWFNGSARFGFKYDETGFDIDPQWIEANGHQLTTGFLAWMAAIFNSNFTTGFDDAMEKQGAADTWRNIKAMRVEGDKLIIETRGEEQGTRI